MEPGFMKKLFLINKNINVCEDDQLVNSQACH